MKTLLNTQPLKLPEDPIRLLIDKMALPQI
jgi:hypothetical protein